MEVTQLDLLIPDNFIKIGSTSLRNPFHSTLPKHSRLPQLETDFQEEPFLEAAIESTDLEPIRLQNSGCEAPVYGIDTSNIDLGETQKGLLCAIRGCVVWREHNTYQYVRHGPFIFHITEHNKQYMYNSLHQTCFNQSEHMEAPVLERMAEHIRNMLERWLQKKLCETCHDSLLLWDGSLTSRTAHKPLSLLYSLLRLARQEDNTILAFSKQTSLTALGRNMHDLIHDKDIPCLLDIDDLIQYQYGKHLNFLGRIYAVKLTPGSLSFRLDIDRKLASWERMQAVEDLLRSDLISDSYPETLRLAHILSRFSANEVLAMQRYISRSYGLRIRPPLDVRQILFGPYGGA